MTTENTGPSPEAFERVQRERDSLKQEKAALEQQLRDATSALGDVAREKRLVEHFRGKEGVSNPYGLAASAIADVTVKGASDDELASRADDWYGRMTSTFGMPAGEPVDKPPEPTPAPLTAPSPNPTAPGASIVDDRQMRVGSPEFKEWAKGRSDAEIKRAHAEGRLVFSGKNQEAMGTL